ncbi:hypothetical protein [Pandoraea bronchicola]|uniref:Flagellar FliJ protein n=1 Tax=Pandoraea bronchicola TaxID=2508287 RepID=A0A5E5BZ49_9BURK|nr:hypothetical protein [Pandoraea bronchicola]VVE90697.1 hypothetical protein PBR20603_04684 [Pandoraea bronchicola]
MSVDRRGYRFSLSPLLAQARWQLDAARDALGVATRQMNEARDRLAQAQAHLRTESARVDGASQVDIGRRMASMAFLATLHERLETAKAEVQTSEAMHVDAREACIQAQRHVERFEKVEAHQWEAFVQDKEAAQARESDADWLARTAHLQGVSHPSHAGDSHD